MIKWILLAAGLAAILLAYAMMSGFADVPCQDGVWDEVRETCVPT